MENKRTLMNDIGILIVAIFLFIVSLGSACHKEEEYSYEVRYVIKQVQDFQFGLNDPSSLKIYDDVLYVYYYRENFGYTKYVYIDFGANTKTGGRVREIQIIEDGENLCTMTEAENVTSSSENFLSYAYARLAYLGWLLGKGMEVNSNGERYGIVSSKLVEREIVVKNLDKY